MDIKEEVPPPAVPGGIVQGRVLEAGGNCGRMGGQGSSFARAGAAIPADAVGKVGTVSAGRVGWVVAGPEGGGWAVVLGALVGIWHSLYQMWYNEARRRCWLPK